MEIAIIDSMKLNQNANDFSLQFWVSGGEMTTSDAPALFSLIDAQDSIKLALFRDRGSSNRITWTTNSISNNEVIDDEYNNKLDWSDPDMFYLISLLFSLIMLNKFLIQFSTETDKKNIYNLERITRPVPRPVGRTTECADGANSAKRNLNMNGTNC